VRNTSEVGPLRIPTTRARPINKRLVVSPRGGGRACLGGSDECGYVQQEHENPSLLAGDRRIREAAQLTEWAPRWSSSMPDHGQQSMVSTMDGTDVQGSLPGFKAMQDSRPLPEWLRLSGLWVEVNVEREMVSSPSVTSRLCLAEFVLHCKQRVLRYAAVQTEQSIRLGYWMDWNDRCC